MADDFEQLKRWEAAGGTWRVIAQREGFVHLALLTCSGGEEMAQLHSTDPAVVRYVESTP